MTDITIPPSEDAVEATSCSLADRMHLLVTLDLPEAPADVRRVANGFVVAIVGLVCGPRFNGAYFTVTDAQGVELEDQPLDGNPLHVGVRSVGIDEPGPELLQKTASVLRNNLGAALTSAGVQADVEVAVLAE